jgi:hypothetical protein
MHDPLFPAPFRSALLGCSHRFRLAKSGMRLVHINLVCLQEWDEGEEWLEAEDIAGLSDDNIGTDPAADSADAVKES